MLSFTTGASRELYTDKGPHGDIEVLVKYFNHLLFEFVGMDALLLRHLWTRGNVRGRKGE
nr:hypothetical protein [Methanobacterium formicicum]